MNIVDKKEFFLGAGLLAAFFVVLVIFFSPVFDGKNGLEYLDNLYNSISKGSAYYIPDLKKEVGAYSGTSVNLTLMMDSDEQADQTAKLFNQGGALVNTNGKQLSIAGDLAAILENCLVDSDLMYANSGEQLSAKYGYNERQVIYNWWNAGKEMDKSLSKQELFKEAKIVGTVNKKAVETAYNYYKIQPQKISDKYGVVIFSLVFYVVYTLWYGFAILFMFEGWGLKLEH
ncbi:MAG: hypothetical protein C4522_07060 [Desulfobacteraceae bacterium]|nr:MAG: hypothetical protein C4522_07060 [Desulfobacteraceae bacterium]